MAEKGFGSKESGIMKKSNKNTLADEFDKIQDKIDNLFKNEKVLWDADDDDWIELISNFRKAGVDFLEIDNKRKTAIAKPENFYQYPSARFAISQDDKGKVKFYKLLFRVEDSDKKAAEITQVEFEENTIPDLIKANDLLGKKDNEKDVDPEEIYDEPKDPKTKDMESGKDEDKMSEEDGTEADVKAAKPNEAESTPKFSFKTESMQKSVNKMFENVLDTPGFYRSNDPRARIRKYADAPMKDEKFPPSDDIENFDSIEAAKQIMELVDGIDIDGLAQIYKIVTGVDLDVENNFELAQGTGEKEAKEIADAIEHMSTSDVKYVYDALREQGLLG